MTIRKDDHIEKQLDVDGIRTREELRKFMLLTYALEDCKVKVRYYVENLENGKRIYIERPTFLNKGCDFVIYAEDVITCKNGNDKAPSHDDIIKDIKLKKDTLTPYDYDQLLLAIKSIYDTEDFAKAIKYVSKLPTIGWNYDLLLKLLRWLFIEQDITYWAGDGRNMLYKAIKDIE